VELFEKFRELCARFASFTSRKRPTAYQSRHNFSRLPEWIVKLKSNNNDTAQRSKLAEGRSGLTVRL
jgi:hypothetical protein